MIIFKKANNKTNSEKRTILNEKRTEGGFLEILPRNAYHMIRCGRDWDEFDLIIIPRGR